MKIFAYLSALLLLFSCAHESRHHTKKTPKSVANSLVDNYKTSDNNANKICQEYTKIKVKEIREKSYPTINYLHAFQLDDLTLLFGNYKSNPTNLPKDDFGGYRLFVMNAKGKLLYVSKGAGDSRCFSPEFYKADDSSPFIILVEIGDEGGSWGNNVYSILEKEIKYIGNINIAKQKKSEGYLHFENIGKYIQINKKGNSIYFNFNTDSVTYDPNGKNEKNLDGKKWHYIYDDKIFKLIKKVQL